jgi:hypothetical protein
VVRQAIIPDDTLGLCYKLKDAVRVGNPAGNVGLGMNLTYVDKKGYRTLEVMKKYGPLVKRTGGFSTVG